MNNEFKKVKGVNETHYILETASGGATSAGAVASVAGGVGKVQKRGNLLAQEQKKEAPKPRNFVVKNAKMGGAGQHKDKKKAEKQGDVKHRKPFAEQGVSEGENWDKLTPQQKAHEYNLDAAQRELDRRHEQGEDMTGAKIDKKTYKIVKPKQQGVAEGEYNPDTFVGKKGTYKGYGITQEGPYQWGISSSLRKFSTLAAAKRHIDKVLVVSEQGVAEGKEDPASLRAKAKEISDKIDAIVKDGGRVGFNDPLSRQLKGIRAKIQQAKKQGVAEGSEQEKPIKKSDWFDPTDMRSPEKQKAAYLNHLAAKKKNKNIKEQGVVEGAPELLKKEMPTHRHAEKLLAQNGVSKDDPDYHHHLNNTIKHLRQFGNIDLINKSDEQGVAEEWSKKYKSSINCSHPKGFSQKAHCAGKKKHNEDMTMETVCPDCGMCQTHGNVMEIKKGAKDSNGYTSCWSGYHAAGTKKSATTGKQVRNCVPNEDVAEDHEIQMASSELQSIAKNAEALLHMVRKYSEQQGLDAWQQSKITKAADYLNAVLQAVSGEQTELEGVGVPSYGVGGYRNRGDDERHDLDDPELQQNRQEVTSYNITINGKPVNPKPIFGRSATIAWGKRQAAAGMDLSNAVISPVRYEESVDPYFESLTNKLDRLKKK